MEAPAVAEVQAVFGDQVEFVGVGGQSPGGDYSGFVESTGIGGFTQLADNDAGELWERFGTTGRSSFIFVNSDGSFTQTSYGIIGSQELTNQVQALIDA